MHTLCRRFSRPCVNYVPANVHAIARSGALGLLHHLPLFVFFFPAPQRRPLTSPHDCASEKLMSCTFIGLAATSPVDPMIVTYPSVRVFQCENSVSTRVFGKDSDAR